MILVKTNCLGLPSESTPRSRKANPGKNGSPNSRSETVEVVFGAYCSTKVTTVAQAYSGDDKCFLFSLFPSCNSYRYQENSSQSNFVHISSEGLGFGGNSSDTARIWIDSDIKSKCSVRSSSMTQNTYEPGSLVPLQQANRSLQVSGLEVWVICDEERRKQIIFSTNR